MTHKQQSILNKLEQIDYDVSKKLALMCYINKETVFFWILDKILYSFEVIGSGVPSLTLSVLGAMFSPQYRLFCFNISVAQVFDIICQFSIKNIFKRPRPSYHDNNDMFFTHGPDKFSFPSGHCARMAMFCHLTRKLVSYSSYPGWYTFGVAIFAVITASRVLMGRHYMSDMIAGVVLGIFEGIFVLNFTWIA